MSTASIIPAASMAPLSRTGILFGLGKAQLVILLIALSRPIIQLTTHGDLSGALLSLLWWTAPLAILGAGSWQGRSILSIVTTHGLFFMRKATGQTRSIPKLRVSREEGRLDVPGPVGQRTRVVQLREDAYIAGASFIYDSAKKNPTATAVLRVETEGWIMADDATKAARTHAVNNLCKELATIPGVERIACHARTYEASHEQLPAPALITANTHLGEFARGDLQDLIAYTKVAETLRRDVLITITIAEKKAAADIEANGGGVEGMSRVLASRVERVAALLPPCGIPTDTISWMSGPEIRAAIRLAYDPEAAAWLADQDWQHPWETPLVTYVQEELDHLVTNSGYHRAYAIERWPAVATQAGFMYDLVARGTVPHTVTQVWEPRSVEQSFRKFTNELAARETVERRNKALGRENSLSHDVERSDLALRHKEMQLGFGDVLYSGWVVVHARNLTELDAAHLWVKDAARGMQINIARGRQAATFSTAALPLGYRDPNQ